MSRDRVRALEDLYFFLTEYWGLDLEEQPHREMCQVIQDAEMDEDRPYGMLVVSRGTYKSSIIRGAAAWKQLRQIFLFDNPYHRMTLASATLALSGLSVNLIFTQLLQGGKNGSIFEDFGPLVSDAKGRKGSMLPKGEGFNLIPRLKAGELASCPEPNFWMASARRVSTGWHADELLCDDLHDEKSIQTEFQREKAKNFFRLLLPIVMPKDRVGRTARIMLNATRWHDDDVPGMVMKMIEEKSQESPGYKSKWTILQRGAHTEVGAEEGPLYFPSVLTEEVLQEKADALGPHLYAANYLNDPIGDRGFVSEDSIRFVPRKDFPELRYIRATVDPNQHTKAKALGCWAAIVIAGYDRFANLWVLDARGSRDWSSGEFLDELFQVDEDYPDIPVLIEDEHMAHFEHALRLEEERRSADAGTRVHLNVRWVPVSRSVGYQQRWTRMLPRFQRGQAFFCEDIEGRVKRELKNELVRGDAAKYSDFLDALAMQETGVRPKVDKTGAQVVVEKQRAAEKSGIVTFAELMPKDWLRRISGPKN